VDVVELNHGAGVLAHDCGTSTSTPSAMPGPETSTSPPANSPVSTVTMSVVEPVTTCTP